MSVPQTSEMFAPWHSEKQQSCSQLFSLAVNTSCTNLANTNQVGIRKKKTLIIPLRVLSGFDCLISL